MSENSNPQAISFANNEIRTYATSAIRLYDAAKSAKGIWDAEQMVNVLPSTADLLDDGSATDGRPRISGTDVLGIMYRMDEYISDLEANNCAKLNSLRKVARVGRG